MELAFHFNFLSWYNTEQPKNRLLEFVLVYEINFNCFQNVMQYSITSILFIFNSNVIKFSIHRNLTKHSKWALAFWNHNVNATLDSCNTHHSSHLTIVWHFVRPTSRCIRHICIFLCFRFIILMFILFIRLWYDCRTRVFYLFSALRNFIVIFENRQKAIVLHYWHQNAVELADMVSIVWKNRSGRYHNKNWNNSKSHSFSAEAF